MIVFIVITGFHSDQVPSTKDLHDEIHWHPSRSCELLYCKL